MIDDEDDVAPPPAPEKAPTDDEGFLATAKAWFRVDREHSAGWRTEAKEDFDFVAGHQWSEEDSRILADQQRPEIVFNRIEPTTEAVTGLEIGNRREVQFIPRTQGDAAANEILTAAAQWMRDECEAEDEETDAFGDTVKCGMGWTETRIDFEEDPEGKLVVEKIDPLEMYWDAAARKRNLADARRLWRVRCMPIEDAEALFPEAEPGDLDAAWARDAEKAEPHSADAEDAYQQDAGGDGKKAPGKEVTIVHLQWWEREPYYRVAMNGQEAELSVADHKTLTQRVEAAKAAGMPIQVQSVRQVRRVYRQAFIGRVVLDRGPAPCEGHFSWEAITGKRDHNKGTFYGLVRGMKDPQRWANKWLSQGLHILNSNAKGGLFAERGAFDNDTEAEDSYARPDRITWLTPGSLAAGRIDRKPPPAFPTGFESLMQFAISSIRDVSGVSQELLGMREANQPNVLEDNRKQAGMTILASLFDSLRRYRKRQGRIVLKYILDHLSDGRLVRIVGEEGAQYVPLIRQPGTVTYDVIVDDSPTSPNEKQRIWSALLQLLPVLGSMLGPDEILALAEYSPLPTAVVQKWKTKKEEATKAGAPIQQAKMQLEQAAAQGEIRKTVSEAAENEAQTAKVAMETRLMPLKAAADARARAMPPAGMRPRPAPLQARMRLPG